MRDKPELPHRVATSLGAGAAVAPIDHAHLVAVVASAPEVAPAARRVLDSVGRHRRLLAPPELERGELALDQVGVDVPSTGLDPRRADVPEPDRLGHALAPEQLVSVLGRVHEVLVVHLERVRDRVHGGEDLPEAEDDERDGRGMVLPGTLR